MLGRSLVLGAVDKRDVVAMMECICVSAKVATVGKLMV
jgi:hypothetical protein